MALLGGNSSCATRWRKPRSCRRLRAMPKCGIAYGLTEETGVNIWWGCLMGRLASGGGTRTALECVGCTVVCTGVSRTSRLRGLKLCARRAALRAACARARAGRAGVVLRRAAHVRACAADAHCAGAPAAQRALQAPGAGAGGARGRAGWPGRVANGALVRAARAPASAVGVRPGAAASRPRRRAPSPRGPAALLLPSGARRTLLDAAAAAGTLLAEGRSGT